MKFFSLDTNSGLVVNRLLKRHFTQYKKLNEAKGCVTQHYIREDCLDVTPITECEFPNGHHQCFDLWD